MYILFVFAWIVVGGEETEVRLLAKNLPRDQYRLKVVGCFRKDNMPLTSTEQLEELGVEVDKTPYTLSFEDTVAYLTDLIRREKPDVVVAAQGVRDIIEAYRALAPAERPPLIEHGGLVEEAAFTSKEFTTRYVGVWRKITEAGARLLANPQDALTVPSMVDLAEFDPALRDAARAELRWVSPACGPSCGRVPGPSRSRRSTRNGSRWTLPYGSTSSSKPSVTGKAMPPARPRS